MMEYKICYEPDPRDLESSVSELIALGWEPIGGVAAAAVYPQDADGIIWEYSQAMIRKAD